MHVDVREILSGEGGRLAILQIQFERALRCS
jgi:hypothetical protein